MKRKVMTDVSHEELEGFVLITRLHLANLHIDIAERIQRVLQDANLTQVQCYSIVSHLEAVYVDSLKCAQVIFKDICWSEEDNESLDDLEKSIKASEQFQDEIAKIDNLQERVKKIHSIIYDE